MHGKIVYGANGPAYFVEGREVSREEFDRAIPSKLDPMLAAGQAPMSRTDREFLEGHCNGSQFQDTPHIGNFYRAEAAKRGVNTTGKVYLSGLAAYPGDPRAWVSDRGDVQRVCEERGYDCDGAVKVRAARRDQEPERVAVADDLVDNRVRQKVAANPDLMRRPLPELRAEAKAEIAPHWAKGD